MKKLTDFIINKRHFILSLFVILTIISGILSTKVKINHDIAKYLPKTSDTRIGMDIMEDEFSDVETSTLNLMFEDLKEDEKLTLKEDLEKIDKVKEVDYENTDKYNKDNYTLYVLTIDDKADSNSAKQVYDEIEEKYKDYKFFTSGDVSENNAQVLPIGIVILAVFCALIILIIMCESYAEPFLFLTSILMAVVLNKGTNIIFNNVSHITSSIAAILQMALSMDYSIMLMNRYDQEKETEKDNVKAMKKALYKAFKAISSSSVTTIVGLLALVFMTFRIGKDLGFVLAKGVLFSLICIFFVLPDLILIFDKLIVKTKKKTLNIKLNKLGKFSYKIRYISVPIFLIVFITSFLLKGNLGIDYTDKKSDEITNVFTENNQIAIIYKNEDEEKISKLLNNIEENEKVDEVLGYGNTINEKLPYDELKTKLNDLGSDVDIEDYLLKIVYYDYYNPEKNNTMTFEEFIDFIETEGYSNEKTNEKIDDKTKKDITRLKNFVNEANMNKKKSAEEIAEILEIDKQNVDDIFTYYLSKNNETKITLNEFIEFMNKDVLTNEKYSTKIDNKDKQKLNTLSKFLNKKTLQKKMTSKEIANLFEIDSNIVDALYKYYNLVNSSNIKMTIREFTEFMLNDVSKKPEYSSSLNEQMIQNLKLIDTFSNLDIINKNMTAKELSNLFGIDEEKINQILLLKYINEESKTKLSISDFIQNVVTIKNNTKYLDGVDISKLESISIFAKNQNNINGTKFNKQELNTIFSPFGNGLVDNIYLYSGLQDDYKLTTQEFVNIVLNIENLPLDENTLNNIKLLKLVIDDSLAENKMAYTSNELAKNLNMNINEVNKIYVLVDYNVGNTKNWTSTPEKLVKLILENKENENIKNSIDEPTLNKLNLLFTIMTSSINNTSYSSSEISNIIGIDETTTKNIFTLYGVEKNNTELNPKEFVEFVLNHKNDELLANSIENDTINDLKLLNSVINGVIDNKKYSNKEISSLLNIDEENVNLLYGLYSFKYVNTNLSLSLREFVSFLLNDVITNEEYKNSFDEEKISKLNTINGIMENSLKNVKYTSDEILAVISKLSNEVEKNTIKVLYTYYGSDKEYNDTWKMTVEEFVRFLNENILQDERFKDFIDDDMKNDIIEAKTTIKDAKELLIGKEYSRVVLNTKFDGESKETFDFIQSLKDMLGNNLKDFYVIGDSPMAYEISKTFHNELNFMTIITMIAIFIVVAVTFKSFLIPGVLVLTIQTAVYLTMGILSIVGENVYFIAILIVQSILMGATIDYAILYTSYYLEHRKDEGIKESIIDSYNKSIHTILTSSSILIIVTLVIANFASAITAKICKTISEGTICSTVLILTLLPAILAFLDRFIVKDKKEKI